MEIILDNGYSFGAGLFETVKVINKKPMFLEKHLKRLNNSLEVLNINKYIERDIIYSYIESEKEENYAIKIMVSDSNTIITKRPDNYININRDIGYRISVSKVLRNSTSLMTYHKTFNYYENIIEKKKAKENGFDEVIFLNEKGEVSEGAVSNIFFIKDNEIYTPKVSSGLLNGTMREYIIENYNVREKDICQKDLKDFDSAFISNSLMGIIPVSYIDKIKYSKSEIEDVIISDLEKLGF